MRDLLGEFINATNPVRGVGAARIRKHGQYWEYDSAGFAACVLPEMFAGAVIDLIAFTVERPGEWLWRTGSASTLGHYALDVAITKDEPLLVCRDPLTWLNHGGRGVVPLDPEGWFLIRQCRVLDIEPKNWAPTVMLELERSRPNLPTLRVAA